MRGGGTRGLAPSNRVRADFSEIRVIVEGLQLLVIQSIAVKVCMIIFVQIAVHFLIFTHTLRPEK